MNPYEIELAEKELEVAMKKADRNNLAVIVMLLLGVFAWVLGMFFISTYITETVAAHILNQ